MYQHTDLHLNVLHIYVSHEKKLYIKTYKLTSRFRYFIIKGTSILTLSTIKTINPTRIKN